MLPSAYRMRLRTDFESAVRRGHRAGRRTLVVHASCGTSSEAVPKVGFVVSKQVGQSVVRNRVKRRLRAVMAGRVATLPRGALVVVRANPAAVQADEVALTADLDSALSRALRPGPHAAVAQGAGPRTASTTRSSEGDG